MEVADPKALVLDIIPPPQLHIMMGAANHLYNIIRRHMIKVSEAHMGCNSLDAYCVLNRS